MNEPLTYTVIPMVLVPLIEALKKMGFPSKFAPLINFFGGLLGGLMIDATPTGAILGILAGMSAGGGYSAFKTLR